MSWISRIFLLRTQPCAEAPQSGLIDRELGGRPLHLVADAARLRLADGRMCLEQPERRNARMRIGDVASICIHGTAEISSPCIAACLRAGIPILWRSSSGHYIGQAVDLAGQTGRVRRAQYRRVDDPETAHTVARALLAAKIDNLRGLARRRGCYDPELQRALGLAARRLRKARDLDAMRGYEGAAAAVWYRALPTLMAGTPAADRFSSRTRRPPKDPVNAVLSYLYAVLTGHCAAAALAAGLDPAVGFLHAERPGRPALALDLLEPFRPAVADATAFALFDRARDTDLDVWTELRGGGVMLKDEGRRAVLGALETRLDQPIRAAHGTETVSWRGAIMLQARYLADFVSGNRSKLRCFVSR